MVQVTAWLLAVLYSVLMGGFQLFENVADLPTGPYMQDSSASLNAGNFGEEMVYGTWYNSQDLREKWVFSEDGVLTIDGEKHTYSVRYFQSYKIDIDGKEYELALIPDEKYLVLWGNNDGGFTLYAEDSRYYQELYKEQLRKERLEKECGELFSRYPDKDGWTENVYCGDIPFLADADYIEQSLENGFFVSTPEQLASYCWYVNTQNDGWQPLMLTSDIDLSGYEWAPMGWGSLEADHPFCGFVDGGGHTIKNMSIDLSTAGSCAGFVGWETWCCVCNISFDGARVSGAYAGVVTGQAIGGRYENITITNSVVEGNYAGSMLGWDANTTKRDCTAEVTVNGEKFDFLSYNDSEKSKIVIDNPVEITIDENHMVTRPEVEGYTNLGWMVFYNGEQVLHRNAENEYSYTYFGSSPGYYEIYLTAFVSGQYVPISNTVSYTIGE